MISVDSVENIPKRRSKSNSKPKGRLVRSLDFIQVQNGPKKRQSNRPRTSSSSSTATTTAAISISSTKKSIWRDSSMPAGGYMTHKMSSVTNNFMSSDLLSSSLADDASDSDIDELVGDLVDPGRGTLVFPQHDEVFRSSPLSTSSIQINQIDEEDEFIDEPNFVYDSKNENINLSNFEDTAEIKGRENESVGMSWNPKQNRWVPLVYRYVFPSSVFTITSTSNIKTLNNATTNSNTTLNGNSSWTLRNGLIHFDSTNKLNSANYISTTSGATFKFAPPKKSIMMGPDGLLNSAPKIDSDARDVCEKLLELMDDKNLLLPADSSPTSTCKATKYSFLSTHPTQFLNPQTSSNQISSHNQYHSAAAQQLQAQIQTPGKSLLSEWSSLPSSPPPPIFHDVCNRPIPELRLSPPMTGKSLGKRLFAATAATTATNVGSGGSSAAVNTKNSHTNNNNNSLCDSPLTKRLRFSSSNSSIA